MTKKLRALAAAAGAAAAAFSASVANADPDVSGMKYSEALSKLQSWGMTAQVSSRVGDRLAEGDCIVTGHTKSAMPARGFTADGPSVIVLVSLDCNGVPASAAQPGYSAASPEGRAAIEEQKKLEWLATDDGQAYCAKAERLHPQWGPIPGCHQDQEE
jgi:hypothetical protein